LELDSPTWPAKIRLEQLNHLVPALTHGGDQPIRKGIQHHPYRNPDGSLTGNARPLIPDLALSN
jgi:hypothetical protein